MSDPSTWVPSEELPPRARRIPMQKTEQAQAKGTTSACAENTLSEFARAYGNRNYLRVRGEYPWR